MSNKQTTYTLKQTTKSITLIFGLFTAIALFVTFICFTDTGNAIFRESSPTMPQLYYMNYDTTTLSNTPENDTIKYGFQLFEKTPQFLGPDNGNPEMIFAGNRLACANCHLENGTKPFSAPLIGIIQRFPQFRGRENKIGTIEERINGCFERSMNGRVLPPESHEMKAIVKYLEYLSRYAPENGKIKGQGFLKIKIPNRAVNLDHGKLVFENNCTACHGNDGKGLKSIDGFTYDYPPLWGENSFNNGAGMNRVITAANFIKGNMPFGTTYDQPQLTDEEAYDVAGYINQQLRPKKSNPELDFPDIKKKPVSTPYPPYADNFPVKQHQLGPYQPIIEYYKKEHNIIKTK